MTLLSYLHGSGGGGDDSSSYTPVEDPNTAQSKATWRVVDLIQDGVAGGLVDGDKSYYLDGVPLQAENGSYNFEGVSYEVRLGLPDQEYLKGYPAVETSISVGVIVANGTPVTRTITNPDVDAVRVHISMESLWQQYDNGDLKGSSVQFLVEIVGHASYTKTITDKFTSLYEVNYRLELPPGEAPWDIRVTKITEDAPDMKSANKIEWSTYTEILDHKLMYPDSAVIGTTVDSSLFGGKIPSRSWLWLGTIIQVPSNYNPQTREYTGIWDGSFQLAWSDNPAWCFYDMLENERYGLGIPSPDKWTLYEIGQYCDELVPDGFGGMEPRFTLNCCIKDLHEAYAMINTMANAFLGMPMWTSGAVSAFQDSPADYQLIVTPANVKDGLLTYEGTSASSRSTVAYVTWNDPDNQYQAIPETVVNRAALRKYGYKPKSVVGFGCTSRGLAHRFGKWLTDTPDAEKETLTYQAGQDHAYVMPGWIVAVADPWVANARMGGRLRDGFEAEVLGDNLINDISEWVLTGATRETSGAKAPDGSIYYTFTDDDPETYEGADSANIAYIEDRPLVFDAWVEKDDVDNRTLLLKVQGIGGDGCRFAIRFKTNTGEYATAISATATMLDPIIIDRETAWQIRLVGTIGGGNIQVQYSFYPAVGLTLATNSVAATGSAAIAGARLRVMSGADYDLLDPRLTLRLDAPITIAENETYLATVVMPDSTVEQRSVTNAPGETDVLSLATALSDFPMANSMYVVTGTDVEPRLFRVLKKTDNGDGWYQITAAEHDPGKYARIEQNIVLDTPAYARDSSSGLVLPPNNPDLTLQTYYADGQLKNMLLFSWEAAADDRVVEYQVEYRVDDGNWTPVAKVPGFLVEKLDVQTGAYIFRVRSVTRTGGTSLWAMDSLAVSEPVMPDVTGLALVDGSSATTFNGGSAKFAWTPTSISGISSSGGTDTWFRSYIVEVRKSGALVRTEYPVVPEYEYTFEKNTANSGPDRSFEISVYQLGNLGQISNTPAVLAVSNPAPSMAGFTPATTDVFKGLRIDWSSWSTTDPDLKSFDLYLDTANPPNTWIATLPSVSRGHVETGLTVGENYNVLIVPRDEFGPGTPSEVAGGTPLILAGADVDVELAESITMSDSLGTAEATLAKLYDRNTTSDGLPRTLGGADQWIQYQFGLATYIDKVILHLADANAKVYFGYSADGQSWSWLAAEADHTLDASGNLVAAASQLAAQGAYLQLDAGLNVAKFPQRVVAKYCRLYLTGTYSTEIYELVFVREVIAEQVVADNLSAISANIEGVNTGYMQSLNYTTNAGVKFDLTNSELHLGGSDGGTTEPGMSFVLGVGLNIVGSIVSHNADTGDYGYFTDGGLTFYFADGGDYYPYKSVKQIKQGVASSGVLFNIHGYWRSAPQVMPLMKGMPVYKAAYSTVDQRMDFDVDVPTEISTGVWQTRIYAKLNTSPGVTYLTWANETATATATSLVTWVYDTDETAVSATPAGVVSLNVSCSLAWDVFQGIIPGLNGTLQSSIEVYFYYGTSNPPANKITLYSAARTYPSSDPGTISQVLSKTVSVSAGTYYLKLGVKVGAVGALEWMAYIYNSTSATISSNKATCNIGASSQLATGDVYYIAFGDD